MGIILIIALVGVAWVVFAQLYGDRGTHLAGETQKQTVSALELLRRRYARGEIDRTEYEQKRQDILQS